MFTSSARNSLFDNNGKIKKTGAGNIDKNAVGFMKLILVPVAFLEIYI